MVSTTSENNDKVWETDPTGNIYTRTHLNCGCTLEEYTCSFKSHCEWIVKELTSINTQQFPPNTKVNEHTQEAEDSEKEYQEQKLQKITEAILNNKEYSVFHKKQIEELKSIKDIVFKARRLGKKETKGTTVVDAVVDEAKLKVLLKDDPIFADEIEYDSVIYHVFLKIFHHACLNLTENDLKSIMIQYGSTLKHFIHQSNIYPIVSIFEGTDYGIEYYEDDLQIEEDIEIIGWLGEREIIHAGDLTNGFDTITLIREGDEVKRSLGYNNVPLQGLRLTVILQPDMVIAIKKNGTDKVIVKTQNEKKEHYERLKGMMRRSSPSSSHPPQISSGSNPMNAILRIIRRAITPS